MRFKQYLTERPKPNKQPTLDEVNKLISSNCKPYINLLNNKYPLYRGIGSPDVFGEKKTHSKRKPRGSDKNVFNFINGWLDDNWHNNRINNIVIGSSGKSSTEKFGQPCMMFPIGKFSYTWMDAEDININDSKTGWKQGFPYRYISLTGFDHRSRNNQTVEEFEASETYKEQVVHLTKPFADYFHTDKGFNIAYQHGYEIWFHCKSYYYILNRWIDNKNWKWRNGQFWQL